MEKFVRVEQGGGEEEEKASEEKKKVTRQLQAARGEEGGERGKRERAEERGGEREGSLKEKGMKRFISLDHQSGGRKRGRPHTALPCREGGG